MPDTIRVIRTRPVPSVNFNVNTCSRNQYSITLANQTAPTFCDRQRLYVPTPGAIFNVHKTHWMNSWIETTFHLKCSHGLKNLLAVLGITESTARWFPQFHSKAGSICWSCLKYNINIIFSLKYRYITFTGIWHKLSNQEPYVTTAFGFFSTAYTRTFRPDSSPAANDALTRGPRPAPTTITTLRSYT